VPTISPQEISAMVGTLRFAHPTRWIHRYCLHRRCFGKPARTS
jgi:hypothetical protein